MSFSILFAGAIALLSILLLSCSLRWRVRIELSQTVSLAFLALGSLSTSSFVTIFSFATFQTFSFVSFVFVNISNLGRVVWNFLMVFEVNMGRVLFPLFLFYTVALGCALLLQVILWQYSTQNTSSLHFLFSFRSELYNATHEGKQLNVKKIRIIFLTITAVVFTW